MTSIVSTDAWNQCSPGSLIQFPPIGRSIRSSRSRMRSEISCAPSILCDVMRTSIRLKSPPINQATVSGVA
jgi:hypothetical protein